MTEERAERTTLLVPSVGIALFALVAFLVERHVLDSVRVERTDAGTSFGPTNVHLFLLPVVALPIALWALVQAWRTARNPVLSVCSVVAAGNLAVPALVLLALLMWIPSALGFVALGLSLVWIVIGVALRPERSRVVFARLSLCAACLAVAGALIGIAAVRAGIPGVELTDSELRFRYWTALNPAGTTDEWTETYAFAELEKISFSGLVLLYPREGGLDHVVPGPAIERAWPEIERAARAAGVEVDTSWRDRRTAQ